MQSLSFYSLQENIEIFFSQNAGSVGVVCSILLLLSGAYVLTLRRRRLTANETLPTVSKPLEVLDKTEIAAVDLSPTTPEAKVVLKAEIVPKPAVKVDKRLQEGLQKTRQSFWGKIESLFSTQSLKNDVFFEQLETILLTADVGVALSQKLLNELRQQIENQPTYGLEAMAAFLKQRIEAIFAQSQPASWQLEKRLAALQKPAVLLFVGVNGVGKTTSVGKIAYQLQKSGLRVLLAAGDTFRAAAHQQLQIWSERSAAQLAPTSAKADPASVVFQAIQLAEQQAMDVVLCDTAGRLHTQQDLMDELLKVKRASGKARAGAPDEIWLVVDATTGQNALRQAKEFHEKIGLSGLVLTKLDGSAKGGILIAIADQLRLPVLFVGIGEQAEDLRPFVVADFVDALFVKN